MPRPSLMIVDDDRALLEAVTGMVLHHWPYIHVRSIESARTALDQLAMTAVDAVLTDLRMKELDGLGLLRAAKALRPEMPIILMSGHVDSSLASEAAHLGAYDVLWKPLNREEFLHVVREALEMHRLARLVQGRRIVMHRLSKRLDALHRLVLSVSSDLWGRQKQPPNRQASLESLMDHLWQHVSQAGLRLDDSQHRLVTAQQHSRHRLSNRIAANLY